MKALAKQAAAICFAVSYGTAFAAVPLSLSESVDMALGRDESIAAAEARENPSRARWKKRRSMRRKRKKETPDGNLPGEKENKKFFSKILSGFFGWCIYTDEQAKRQVRREEKKMLNVELMDKTLTIAEMESVVGGAVRPKVRVTTRKGPVIRHGNAGNAIGNAISNLMLYFLEHNNKKKG